MALLDLLEKYQKIYPKVKLNRWTKINKYTIIKTNNNRNKNPQKELVLILYFILGIIFATVGLTLLDFITALIANLAELVKGWFSVKIAEYNSQITNLTETDNTHVIGFSIPQEDEVEYEDDI